MSLSGLHSCMDSFKLVICNGGCMNLLSMDWVWLRQLAYSWVMFILACSLWYCVMRSMLCSKNMLSLCSSSSSLRHCCMVPSGTCHWHRYFFFIDCALHLSFLWWFVL